MKVYKIKKDMPESALKIPYTAELNESQVEVVFSPEQAVLVLAGPGSGKTRVLVYRVAYLLEKGVLPSEILLLTFTNKAAKNMVNRVQTLLGQHPKGLTGGTFHSIGNLLLRKYGARIGIPSNFSIIDNEDSRQIVSDVIASMFPKKDKHFPSAKIIFSILSYAKNTLSPMRSYIKEEYDYDQKTIEDIVAVAIQYEKRKKASNLLDFDDLLTNWNMLLDENDVQRYCHDTYKHIVVDEFQDTNKLQFEIIKKMVGPKTNIMVVGDDCQSIYSFRGADVKNILDFPKAYPVHTEYRLEINYRSTPEILQLINESIKHNTDQFKKELQAVRPSKDKPALIRCKDTKQEAHFICQRILELQEEGESLEDIGVLFRSGYHSAELELELAKHALPYRMIGGIRFFEQAHIKDITAFLKLFNNNADELAWKRILTKFEGIGDTTALKIWDILSRQADARTYLTNHNLADVSSKAARGLEEFRQILKAIVQQTSMPGEIAHMFSELFYEAHLREVYPDFKERMLDIQQYVNLANQYTELAQFLQEILLDADLSASQEASDANKDEEKLTLSTIHQAKGLEWDSVFIMSLAENRFPSNRTLAEESDASLQEERRLFYVACSRAKNELYLCLPMTENTYWGGSSLLRDSQFIQELPQDVYEEWTLREDESDKASLDTTSSFVSASDYKY